MGSFDSQPVLKGPRILIRPIEPADWEPMYAAAADPGIWEQHPATDRYKEDVFRQYFDDALNCGSGFAFVDRRSGALAGSSRFHGLDIAASEIEIGWTFLARAYWGGSYNAEIKQLMLGHAFRFVDTVVFWVGADNIRSRTAMEKVGGVLREGIFRRGDDPYVVFEVSKPV
jgi:RimJ/RimL family protein N-acetyltransferase